MTGNLGMCWTEIGSHLQRLSKRKADFTADGSAVAGLWTPGAQLGMRDWTYSYCCCRPVNTIVLDAACATVLFIILRSRIEQISTCCFIIFFLRR